MRQLPSSSVVYDPATACRNPNGHQTRPHANGRHICVDCGLTLGGPVVRPKLWAPDGRERRRNGPKGKSRLSKIEVVIERDGLACFYCEHPLLDPQEGQFREAQWWPTFDHLLPRVLGGGNDLNNLVLSCKGCNTRKGDRVHLLAEVIRRLRRRNTEAQEKLVAADAFIEHLQWELFDAGLGELPGRSVVARNGRRPKLVRPRPRIWSTAEMVELGERVCANIRSENSGSTGGRTAAVVKRGRRVGRS